MAARPRSLIGRYVSLEWDRFHDSFDALVVAKSPSGTIVKPVHDFVPLGGFKWIRADEINSLDVLDDDHPAVRLALLRGTQIEPPGRADLAVLLRTAKRKKRLLFVYQERTGSDAGLAGFVASLSETQVTLDDVDTDGRLSGEVLFIDCSKIISVEWETPYLVALADLVRAEEPARQ